MNALSDFIDILEARLADAVAARDTDLAASYRGRLEKAKEQLRLMFRDQPAKRGPLDGATEVHRKVVLPTECARCGNALPPPAARGRPKLYCSAVCRKAAYEDRRAKRDGAVQVQLVEKTVTRVYEKPVKVQHKPGQCLAKVMNDPQLRWRSMHDLAQDIVNHHRLDEAELTRLGGAVEYLLRSIWYERAWQMKQRGVPVILSSYAVPRYDPWERDELRPVMQGLKQIDEVRAVRRDEWFRELRERRRREEEEGKGS